MNRKLKEFVDDVNAGLKLGPSEPDLFASLKKPFTTLLRTDDWLPEEFAKPHPTYYRQYLLHVDPDERFSVVSFVWGPGQKTPIHNHTVWGMVGVLRGAEISTRYAPPRPGMPMQEEGEDRLDPGMIDFVSPTVGDVHAVRNAFADRVSISIHVYGANIGRVSRSVYDPSTGAAKTFISGFSNV